MKKTEINNNLKNLNNLHRGSFFAKCNNLFRNKKNNMNTSLTKKNLLLDTIIPNPYFLLNLEKIYGKELGNYLAKYLTFWLQQPNKHGPYFLDYYQDYCHEGDKWDATCNDIKDFCSEFVHVEVSKMNNLPEDRKKVAIIKILGKQVKFKKVNHFFNFISNLNFAVDSYNVNSENIILDNEEDYILSNFPQNKIKMIYFGNYSSRPEEGFFHINFDETLNMGSVHSSNNPEKINKNKIQVLKDFIGFLKILEIEIKYTPEKMITFYKNLETIKADLILKTLTSNENNENTMSNYDFINYINKFLDILEEHFTRKTKLLLTVNKINLIRFFPQLRNLLKIKLINKITKIRQNKKMLIPIIFGVFIYLFIRFNFTAFFFFICSIFIFSTILKNQEKRNFPSFSAYFFDLRQNFRYRYFTFQTFLKVFFILRTFYFIFYMNLNFDIITKFLSGSLILMMQSVKEIATTPKLIQKEIELSLTKLGRTYGLIINKQPNCPISIMESAIIQKTTSMTFNKNYNLYSFYASKLRNKIIREHISLYPRIVERELVGFPEASAEKFPWKDHKNCFYQSLAVTATKKHINSNQELYEMLFPFVTGQSNLTVKPESAIILEQQNTKIIKIEGEYIINNVVVELKQYRLDSLLNPENEKSLLFIPEEITKKNKHFPLSKLISILELNKGYHCVLFIDLTEYLITDSDKIKLKKIVEDLLKKREDLYGTFEKRKFHIEFVERIFGFEDEIIKTRVNDFILQNESITSVLKTNEEIIEEAKKQFPKDNETHLLAQRIEQLQKENKFDPFEEIKKTGIIEQFQNSSLEVLLPPKNFSSPNRIDDRTSSSKSVIADSHQLIKDLRLAWENFSEKIITYNNENKAVVTAIVLPDHKFPDGSTCESISTHPLDTSDKDCKALSVYNKAFAEKQIKRFNLNSFDKIQKPTWGDENHKKEVKANMQSLLDKTGYKK